MAESGAPSSATGWDPGACGTRAVPTSPSKVEPRCLRALLRCCAAAGPAPLAFRESDPFCSSSAPFGAAWRSSAKMRRRCRVSPRTATRRLRGRGRRCVDCVEHPHNGGVSAGTGILRTLHCPERVPPTPASPAASPFDHPGTAEDAEEDVHIGKAHKEEAQNGLGADAAILGATWARK